MHILLVLGIIAVVFMANNQSKTDTSDPSIIAGLTGLASDYGWPYARCIEKLARCETNHFKSTGWKQTASLGMGAVKGQDKFPFGWGSLKEYPHKTLTEKMFLGSAMDSGNGNFQIGFPSAEDSIRFTGWFIKTKRGGNVGQWHSMLESEGDAYTKALATYSSPICDAIENHQA